ncbi:penicillin-insensitive murein endopeptidase [Pseudoalteromonas sp. McH1-42]|uniref:penicillin-insensitive murein endopeptidase n=1 Tax=Pseudoalteromonas sp. McH1-42 TaxID=2917752 RepID=UPI001EF50692|nr:penicillin-insensitive murein endopeptidase [Pseudoalteromonas sp. McH1-42]MCG7563262.1 penicillin-insensitive murein endopeptidase [Pseudoalteromonas sp. McH1-42]
MKLCYLLFIAGLVPAVAYSKSSTCYGTTGQGSLKGAVELPKAGNNFVGYSALARLAGRTYVHSEVYEIVTASYQVLEKTHPDKVYKYAETGFAEGGRFRPHKTHRNGLSVDFMTPVIDEAGQSVHLPTHPFNKFGYLIEFDEHDQFDGLEIDYAAMAAHIVALHKQAKRRGHDLWRVIFDPKLQPNLFSTQYGEYLKTHIQFSKKPSWVRHDEHYHIDFDIPCEPMAETG